LTNRKITVGGKIFKELLASCSYDEINNSLVLNESNSSGSDSEEEETDKVINPLTNRKITVGGKLFEELLLESCVYDEDNNTLKLVNDKKSSSDEKVINPLTNRKITVGGKIFNELLLTFKYNKNTNSFSE
jgi:hypothetical protein